MAYTSSPYEPMGPGLSHLAAGDATDLRTSEWYRGSQAGYPETGYATGSHDDPGPDGHYGYPHSWRLGQWSEGGTHPDSSSLDTSTFEGAGATGSEEGEEESDDEEVDPLIGMDAEGIPFFDISEQEAEERRMGRSLRQRWLNFVEMSTFFVSDRWIKSNLPGCLGPKATREQLLAWREKLTMFDILLGGYIIVAVVFLALPIVFCTQKPGEKTGLLSKDVWLVDWGPNGL